MSSGAVSCACREAGMAMEKPNRLAMILVNPLKDSLVCPTGLAKASAEIDAKKPENGLTLPGLGLNVYQNLFE